MALPIRVVISLKKLAEKSKNEIVSVKMIDVFWFLIWCACIYFKMSEWMRRSFLQQVWRVIHSSVLSK